MEEIVQTKMCSRCKIDKFISEFGKDKYQKDGLNIYCKQCIKDNKLPKKHIEVEYKTCTMCNQKKHKSEFNKDKNRVDGLYPYCKLCKKIASSKEIINREVINSNRIKNRKRDILKYLIRECTFRARTIKNVLYDSNENLYNYLKPMYDKGVCECCGKKLESNVGKGIGYGCDNSYSIDRILPEKGYIIGNVAILCYKCNRLKNNGTIEELKMIINWMEQKLNNKDKNQN
jgi:hypothetical protein